MKKMTILLLILQWSFSALYAGSVEAKVNNTEIVAGDSVQLTLEAKGESIQFPDIQTVGDYPIEGSSRGSRMHINTINGNTTQVNVETRTVLFTPEKNMTIPSFEVTIDGDKLKTNPIEIQVVTTPTPTQNSGQKATLTMELSKNEVFVGEPVELKVLFGEREDAQILQVEFEKPNLSDFLVKDMGDEKISMSGSYRIHELRYILIPKYEGNFTIPTARAKVAFRDQSRRARDPFDGMFGGGMFDTVFMQQPIWKQIVSNSVPLVVKKAPQNTDLIGNFKVESSVDATEVKANKPVNLTLRISGEGNLEDFEAPKFEIDGVTVYSDDAKVDSNLIQGKLQSSYEKKYVFIASNDFTIPAQTFSLFDTKTNKLSELETTSFEIKITDSKPAATHSAVQTLPPVQTPTKESIAPKELAPSNQNIEENETFKDAAQEEIAALTPWMLVLAFGGGILVTLLGIKFLPALSFKKTLGVISDEEALKILYPHINSDKEAEQMVRNLYAKKGGDKSVVIDKAQLKGLLEKYRV